MARAGEVWSYPQAKATSNAALAARVAELERDLAGQPAAQQGAEHIVDLAQALRIITQLRATIAQCAGSGEAKPIAHVTGYYAGYCVIKAAMPGQILPINMALFTVPPAQPDSERSISRDAQIKHLTYERDLALRANRAMQAGSERDAALLDLRDFKESQWWLKELDEAIANGTDDQKRAVGVVRHMLRVAAIVTQQGGQP